IYIVPTPIGNLKDITFRAVEILQEVDLILAEDTRVSGRLLKHYNISTPLKPFHSHNEHREADKIVEQLMLSDNEVAVISDAGTPGISDPAFLLVRAAAQAGISIETLPGATALVPALVNSALPTTRFAFEGFLPVKKGRQKRITALLEEERTMIFYESPYRLLKCLQQFIDFFGPDRQAAVSREISKMFEENVRGSLYELKTHFESKKIKGEIVIVLQGKDPKGK
ncbi:UNVERIFIED_CONTAM: hypothetical protein GTU68_019864, partial [Idotea baltica]|nr:hypothetical protein [Idotea baltica]